MEKPRTVRLRKSIATRLLAITFSIYLVVTIILTVGHMVAEYAHARSSVQDELEVIEETFEPALGRAMWDLSQVQLHSIVEGMVRLPQVVAVQIVDENGEVVEVASRFTDEEGGAGELDDQQKLEIIRQNEYLHHEFDITYRRGDQAIVLGRATLFTSSDVVFDRVKVGYLFIIFNAMIKTAALWILFLLVGRSLLTRPLSRLTEAVRKIDLNTLEHQRVDIQTRGDNELKMLEEAFNDMRQKLLTARTQLDDVNQNLEILVETRTRAIEMSLQSLQQSETIAQLGYFERNWQTGEGFWSDGFCRLLGLPPGTIHTHESFMTLLHEDDQERVKAHIQNSLETKTNMHVEFRCVRGDGTIVDVMGIADNMYDSNGRPLLTRGTFQNISDRKRNDERIRHSLQEKEILLREIHHRVKNNFQVISSLLNLQCSGFDDPRVTGALQQSRARVATMALVHEKLYKTDNFEQIDLSDYIRTIAANLSSIYGIDSNRIVMRTKIEDVDLDLQRAIPCGMILNELLSNAMKHGLVGAEAGEILVELRRDGDVVHLSVFDSGGRFPPSVDFRNTESLGLQLVMMFVAQLRGEIDLQTDDGITCFNIRFASVMDVG